MATRPVVEVQCERCQRKEYQPVPEKPANPNAKPEPALVLTFGAVSVTFNDLCSPCNKTVGNLIGNIKKAPKGKSPERVAKKKEPAPKGEAPSVKN
jgi:hypothetical protein